MKQHMHRDKDLGGRVRSLAERVSSALLLLENWVTAAALVYLQSVPPVTASHLPTSLVKLQREQDLRISMRFHWRCCCCSSSYPAM